MGCTACEQFERMGQDIDNGFERLDGPLGRPGDIENEALDRRRRRRHAKGARGDLTARMASARPGASRSITVRVASGVRSVGENPVPPVVTTSPANDEARSVSAAATGSTPVGSDPPLHHSKAVGGQCGCELLPGTVLAGAAADGLRNGQYLGFECHPCDATPGGTLTGTHGPWDG